MNSREYKPFENATSEHAAHWIFRKFCKHTFVAHRLDKNLFEKENKHLYITCTRCGEQYICNEIFNYKIQKVMSKENPYYKKLSWCITREGSKYPFIIDYTYKFTTNQFL